MAPVRTKKRGSGASPAPQSPIVKSQQQKIPAKMGTPAQRSPIKKRKGITLEQKQAIIDNLQLEITDRARRLRAQYHARAQSLRSRVEMRVNRIPRSMLKITMEELVARYADQQKRQDAASRPPPVPQKDYPVRASPVKAMHASRGSPRPRKQMSDEMAGGDKENRVRDVENAKKKQRGGPVAASSVADATQILSPTSTNTRNLPRERAPVSPTKSQIARPASPTKPPPSAARPTIASSSRPAPTRKITTSSTASSATGAAANTRTRRAAPATSKPPSSRPATRTGRRVSDSSEASTSTVVKKTASSKTAPAAGTKKTVMGTIRKGVTGGTNKKAAPAPKSAPASTAGTTRVLRKRG